MACLGLCATLSPILRHVAARLNSGVRPRKNIEATVIGQLTPSLAAFVSGLVGVPLLLALIFHAIIPGEMNARGNSGFWGVILIGSALAGTVVWFKQAGLWLALVAGPLGVLVLLVPWLAWRVIAARRIAAAEGRRRK